MALAVALLAVFVSHAPAQASAQAKSRPNVVIVLTDDQGWRDVGYQGSPHAKTPNIDALAANGVRFDYFYAAQQMCSPGRFAIMTGRTPLRGGVPFLDPIRPRETTIAQVLRLLGYRTGQFGKWHLGSGASHPLKMGFNVSYFSPNFFDIGGKLRDEVGKKDLPIVGDSSVFTMDLALDWIRKQHADKQPFFAYVCFGSPHSPHRGSEEFKAIYKDLADKKAGLVDFYAELSGIDAAVGNMRKTLRDLGIADDTLVWFASDNGGINGPLSNDPAGFGKGKIGARTVSCLEWPGRVKQHLRTDCAAVHMDIYPTILDIVGTKAPNPVLDGISLVPLLDGQMKRRPAPIGFLLGPKLADLPKTDFIKGTSAVWIDGSHKLSLGGKGKGDGVRLVDIYADPAEKTNLAAAQPERVAEMRKALDAWRRSVRDSFDGKDYPDAK
jgi:arylsulfatase A-like enzyme